MSRFAMCPSCGHRMRRCKDMWGNWDGTYVCDYCDEEDVREGGGEDISVYEAALIWASNGKDEDYTFGYDEDELERAL